MEGLEEIGCKIGKSHFRANRQKAMSRHMAWGRPRRPRRKAVKDQARTINNVSPECGGLLRKK